MHSPLNALRWAVMLTTCSSALAADLRVEISNADPAEGQVYFALYDSATGYQNRTMRDQAVSTAGDLPPSVVFSRLPAGDYVVTVFQDLNANRKLDTNMLGIPTEPYGFSRNAMGNMGPPAFKAAAVTVPASDDTLVIDIELRK